VSRRLYFLLPNRESCVAVVEELHRRGVADRNIHVIGNHLVPLNGLHKASVLQKTEFGHGIEMGIGVGGAAGMLGGLLAVTFPPAGLVLGGAAVLGMALAGAGFGALVSALVAKDIPNHQLRAFEAAVDAGQLLLIVDVPRTDLDAVVQMIQSHHPEAEVTIRLPPAA